MVSEFREWERLGRESNDDRPLAIPGLFFASGLACRGGTCSWAGSAEVMELKLGLDSGLS